MTDYMDWDEPILEKDYNRARKLCKDKARHYSEPGYPVEHIGTVHEDQPDGSTSQKSNWRCKFRSHNQ
ncbi:MAG: hypothetical protein MJA27_03120 [Pseudanabaenales cyanobacterium]|nr:hypothetical protein [Pseudanabaenales cyanobacterium]